MFGSWRQDLCPHPDSRHPEAAKSWAGGYPTPQRCPWPQETLSHTLGFEVRIREPSPGSRITSIESVLVL